MDNQQATNWLCGILEGEGSFSRGKHSGTRFRISNTESDLIELCVSILKQNHILHTVSNGQRGKRKREYEIAIQSEAQCARLYRTLQPTCRFQGEFESSETTREGSLDLYWLIGILEAEGSFHINRRESRGGVWNLNPEITICSTTTQIVSKIADVLFALKLSYYVQAYTPEKHTPYKVVAIRGYLRVQQLLKCVTDFQTSKYKTKASLLKEFTGSRLTQHVRDPYTERQKEIFQILRNMI